MGGTPLLRDQVLGGFESSRPDHCFQLFVILRTRSPGIGPSALAREGASVLAFLLYVGCEPIYKNIYSTQLLMTNQNTSKNTEDTRFIHKKAPELRLVVWL
jgi:hypothetical protein